VAQEGTLALSHIMLGFRNAKSCAAQCVECSGTAILPELIAYEFANAKHPCEVDQVRILVAHLNI
jgi:hypothetical protein